MTVDISIADEVRIEDPAWYLGDPWSVYDRVRRETPVLWIERLNTWLLTRYEDVRYVAKNPGLFSNASGLFLHDALRGGSVADELFGDAGEQIGVTDPPRHRELRRIATPPFTPHGVTSLRPAVEEYCDQLIAAITPGEPVEWVESVASKLPMHTACVMLGLPEENADQIRYWSDELEKLAIPMSEEEFGQTIANFATMVPYLSEQFEHKRACPADDMISMLLDSELDNEKLSLANVMMFTQTILAAGNDTTRAAISGIVATLAEHPEQLERLVADRSLIPNAIEEILRWVTPARGFLRTAAADTDVSGTTIRSGEHVYLAYDAANRDPEVFPDPDVFDVTREVRRGQVAFGYGTHVCIGAPIVRMELAALMERLIARFPRWEIVGTPSRTMTQLRSGWVELPVVFHDGEE
jgi:cytochrome P450